MKTRLIILLLLFPAVLWGQISAPGSNAVRNTDYPSAIPDDPIFIFCSVDGSDKGSLRADSPGGTGPYTFNWSAWDTVADAFLLPVRTDIDMTFSLADSLGEGGYQVHITDGSGYDTTLVAWVHIDSPFVDAELQDFKCPFVALNGTVDPDLFYYEDLSSGLQVQLPNDVGFIWSSSPVSSIPNSDHELNPITYDPPLEDVWYKLEVTDSFGCGNESTFFYESIHVLADFGVNPDQGEAPLEVFITDNSIRALNYLWRFGDDSLSTSPDPVSHIYYKPGEYNLHLSIESDKYCVDSMSLNITVEPSSLDIPNVFTPDGNGDNDFFYVESKSLRYLSVQVFSKSGQRVYLFEGKEDALKDWQGWDGYIGGSKASPGIYFYIIMAIGWDNVIYEGEEHRGFLYLYR
ncbi:MAG TPA: gliding motility-associated C-terminal domain-containing protein [Bacteroidales bacterium]|nr:gliding motility-associated C-terminal domain-containing protein [Bacteroidales bacterium]